MNESKEITALFHLMDDPDEDVFSRVTDRIISLGNAIIPNLENLSESSTDPRVQERVEVLIHQLLFRDLTSEITEWKKNPKSLLDAALMISKFGDPDFSPENTRKELEKIRRNIWLELNNFLTSLERVNVISGILFQYYKFQGADMNYESPNEFLLSKSIITKKGNPISNGILILILCDLVDVEINATNIPKQFILWHDYEELPEYPNFNGAKGFYLDPGNGMVYSQLDVDHYLSKSGFEKDEFEIKSLTHPQVMALLIEEYARCFATPEMEYKQLDLNQLAEMLKT